MLNPKWDIYINPYPMPALKECHRRGVERVSEPEDMEVCWEMLPSGHDHGTSELTEAVGYLHKIPL